MRTARNSLTHTPIDSIPRSMTTLPIASTFSMDLNLAGQQSAIMTRRLTPPNIMAHRYRLGLITLSTKNPNFRSRRARRSHLNVSNFLKIMQQDSAITIRVTSPSHPDIQSRLNSPFNPHKKSDVQIRSQFLVSLHNRRLKHRFQALLNHHTSQLTMFLKGHTLRLPNAPHRRHNNNRRPRSTPRSVVMNHKARTNYNTSTPSHLRIKRDPLFTTTAYKQSVVRRGTRHVKEK